MIIDLATHPRRFLTVPELAVYARVPKVTVYWHIRHQMLPARRFGRLVRVETVAAREWFEVYILPKRSESQSDMTAATR